MADNRMNIRCNICGSWSPTIATYFPHTQWIPRLDGLAGLEDWLQEHHHDNFSSSGPTHFAIAYEEVNHGSAAIR